MESKPRFIRLLVLCALLFGAGVQAASIQYYELLRSEQPFLDGAKSVLFQTNVLTYTDTDIRPDTRYYYWVRTVELTSTSKQVARQTQPGYKVTLTLKAPVKAPKNLILPVFADLDYYGADNLWPSGYGERSLYENSEAPNHYLIERELSAGGTGPGEGGRLNYRRYDLDLSGYRRSSSSLSLVFRLDHQQPDEVLLVETPALAVPLTDSADPAPGNLRATFSPFGIKVDWNAASGVSGWSQPLAMTTMVGDQIAPTLVITGHTNNNTLLTNIGICSFSGTAADNTGVIKVIWSNHRGGSGTATGTTTWSANVSLSNGENQLRFTAADAYGNETSQIVRVNMNPNTYKGGVWNWAISLAGEPVYDWLVATDSQTNAWVAGRLTTNLTYGAYELINPALPYSKQNSFLLKLSRNGSLIWATALQSTNSLVVSSIVTDPADNLVVVGTCTAPAIFGNYTLTDTDGRLRYFIAKFAPDGSLAWVKTTQGTSSSSLSRPKFDSAGNVILSGAYGSGTLFSPPHQIENQTSEGLVFLAKLDTSGNTVWTRSAASGGPNSYLCAAVDPAGQIYLGGTYTRSFAFQTVTLPARTTAPLTGPTTFLLKFDSEGAIQWGRHGTNSHRLNNADNFRPAGLALDPAGHVFMAGNYNSDSFPSAIPVTVGFGSQTLTTSSGKSFLIRFEPDGEASWIKTVASVYPAYVKTLCADNAGQIYLASAIDDPGFDSYFQLFRFDCQGEQANVQWVLETFTAPLSSVNVHSFAMSPNGNGYVVGRYSYGLQFPSSDSRRPELTLNGSYDSKFLASLSPRLNPYPSSIYLQPTNQTVAVGKPFTLNVGAACLGSIRYQWYKDDALIANATNALLTIPQAAIADSGSYQAKLLTCEGIEQSAMVHIQVLDVPAVTNLMSEVEVMRGQPLELSFTPTGTPPLSIQWYRNGTLLPGAVAPMIVVINAQPKDAGLYYAVITNQVGKTTNMTAHVTVYDSAAVLPHARSPQIISQPQDITRTLGNPFQLQVTVYGKSPFTYQWYKDDQPLLDATNRTYTVNSTLVGHTGEYHVVIFNDIDTVTSRKASVKIVPALLTSAWPAGSINFNQGLPLSLEVSPGMSYRLQVSSDLNNWTTLHTFQSDTALFNYLDIQAINRTRGFYRVISP